MPLASFPSPAQSVWQLGPIPIRAYALCVIAGVVVAVVVGERRWQARGGTAGAVTDVSIWAVLFGLVGGRLYHVLTDWQLYFGQGAEPLRALKIWEGGLGIWGAIALGGVGAWIACRRRGIPFAPFSDALAPGIALAQAIGRWGNWFNQELFGRPTDLPWAVEITRPPEGFLPGTYHPTFLYESLWSLGVAVLVIWADRRFRLGGGRVFALYAAGYAVGRAWIEWLRIDPAHEILGLRLNDWTALVVFLGAVSYLWINRHKTREETVSRPDQSGQPDQPDQHEPHAADTDDGPDHTLTDQASEEGAAR